MSRTKTLSSLLVIGMALVLSSCSNSKQTQNKDNQQAAIMVNMDLMSLDISNGGGTTWEALNNSMEGLYKIDHRQQPVPAIATKIVQPTDNQQTYTFNLRPDAKWSNGDPVTANDFVAAWRRSVQPTAKSGYSYIFSGIQNADAILAGQKKPRDLGVTALGAHKLQVKLDHPMPYFNKLMALPAFFPESHSALQKFGARYGTKSQYLYFNGPFKITDWDGASNSWVFRKNKYYYDRQDIKLSSIKCLVIKDSNTAHELFEQNKLDDAKINGVVAKSLQGNKNLTNVRKGGTYILRANLRNGRPLANTKMRQALSLAIDRRSLTKDILADGSVPAYTYTSKNVARDPITKKDFGSETQPTEKHNVTLAKKLWNQGRQEAHLQGTVHLELSGNDDAITKHVAEFLQSDLQKALPKLKVTMKNVPDKTVTTAVRQGNFDAHQTLWLADFSDPISFMGTATSNSTKNDGHYQDPTFDQLYQQANTNATNPTQYWALLRQMEQRLNETVPNIPLYQMVESHLVNPHFKGVVRHPVGLDDYTRAYLTK